MIYDIGDTGVFLYTDTGRPIMHRYFKTSIFDGCSHTYTTTIGYWLVDSSEFVPEDLTEIEQRFLTEKLKAEL